MLKKVRTLSIYRKIIERLPEFRLVSPQLTEDISRTIGFDGIPVEGDSILPVPLGDGVPGAVLAFVGAEAGIDFATSTTW